VRALVLALAVFAAAAAPATARTIDVRPGDSIQAAVDAADRGDRVLIRPGVYREPGSPCITRPADRCAVVVRQDDITLAGRPRAGRPVELRARGGQLRGIEVAPGLAGACEHEDADLDNVTIARLTVRGFPDTGVALDCVNGWRVTRVRAIGNREYGVFPVHTAFGRLDHSFAAGARDTGLYIGQSRAVRVDHNRAVRNVSGLEIENSTEIRLDHNVSKRNSAGILSFALPGLSIPVNAGNMIAHNVVEGNNRRNGCGEGDPVCGVPIGSGVLLVAADGNRVEDNRVRGNRTLGIAVTSYCVVFGLAPADCAALGLDPFPDGNRITRNTVTGNGFDPDSERLPVAAAAVDLAWDGSGTGNCWSENAAMTFFPSPLPPCP